MSFFQRKGGPAFKRVSHAPTETPQFPPLPPKVSTKRVSRSAFDAMPQGPVQPNRFQSPIEKQRYTLLLAVFTCGAMIFTVFFAFNSSLIKPLSTRLIFNTPATSVLVLNIASQVTIFCLAELTICVFEAIRWAFAASARGVQGYTFLSLSRATNIVGVLALLAVSSTAKQSLSGSHRFWGSQRILFLVLRSVLGILLLSDISFKSTYPEVTQFPINLAGLSPINSSLPSTYPYFNLTATTTFWWYFPALLTDVKRVRGVPPLNCSGTENQCLSYFLPGSMTSIQLDPNQPVLVPTEYPQGTAYVQIDAPGYQMDFQKIDRVNDPYMTLLDCHLYGIPEVAVQLCLKDNGNEILAAMSGCPSSVQNTSSCLNTTDWRTTVPLNTKVAVTQRRAATVFDRQNSSIIDILDFTAPQPMNYTADDFFQLYDSVFALPLDQQWNISTQYFFLLSISEFLSDQAGTENGTGNEDQLSRLQDFLATPVFLFNNVVYSQNGGPTPDMGTQAALATPSYRLIIAPYTLYSFFVGSFFALAWCLIALACTMLIQTPNTTVFPEFDIASKINPDEGYEHNPFAEPNSLTDLLWPLSNASTLTIRAALRGKQLFARFSDREYEGARRVVLSLQDNGLRLSRVIPPTFLEAREPVETEVDDQGSSVYPDEGFGPGRTILSPLRFEEFAEPYVADPMAEEFRQERLTPHPELSSRYS